MNNVTILRLAGAALLLAATLPAQDLFDGEWSPLHHEDYNERIPGPDLGDFAGLPINDSARAFAESLGRFAPYAAGTSVPRARVSVHLSWPVASQDLGGKRSHHPAVDRDQELHQHI